MKVKSNLKRAINSKRERLILEKTIQEADEYTGCNMTECDSCWFSSKMRGQRCSFELKHTAFIAGAKYILSLSNKN